ncbi:hypothetical protein N7539_008762 [Penicillium diatomitis]|uniref:Ribonuclease H1 N-terminal domain-containing protein n=1 Tax=Penicillium diatomitis TaxID=2819901 RepID=A0A9X0BLP2_9EURO|nr:uncharacterized protein N7539_008762 [Penicillium diatomitis]KAJ5471819.1 hypothetical protein N7539_008762 [Penicillium diatomitis]
MAPPVSKSDKFYAVYKGRVDKPTIYSSWSQAHPRVIECEGAEHKKWDTLEDARKGMKDRGFEDVDIFVKKSAETKIASLRKDKYYAVAGGKTTRVFTSWEDAKEAINGTTACQECFSTKQEAEEFIENWKDAYADVCRRAIRQGLNEGWKARDMSLNIGSILLRENDNERLKEDGHEMVKTAQNELPKIEQLSVKEENQE